MEQAFFGAIVGSAVTVIFQWFIGPRLERRVRAQERWEQFLIELAALTTGRVSEERDTARYAWMAWRLAVRRPDDDEEDLFRKFQLAATAWSDSLVRIEWLVYRVVGDPAVADYDTRVFHARWLDYRRLHHDLCSQQQHFSSKDPSPWLVQQDVERDLRAALEVLTSRVGIRVGPIQALRARWRPERRAQVPSFRSEWENYGTDDDEGPGPST